MPASSASSASGSSSSSRISLAISAFSESRWVLTDTYSPTAMLIAPAASPARPAVSTAPRSVVAAATPITRPAVDTMPSLAPSTPARSQFSRPAIEPSWASSCSGAVDRGRQLTRSVAPCARGRRGDAVRQLDVELGQAAGVVRGEQPPRRAPTDVDVGVVVHLLGLVGHGVDDADGGREVRRLHRRHDGVALALPPAQSLELRGHLVVAQESAHGPIVVAPTDAVGAPCARASHARVRAVGQSTSLTVAGAANGSPSSPSSSGRHEHRA